MSFPSIHFIFFFLPGVLLAYYILPWRSWRNIILVLASLIFFGWADPTHLPVLIASVLINYILGIFIGRSVENGQNKVSSVFTWLAVAINLAALCFYKYLGFIGENLQALLQIPLQIPIQALPIGISYFTFSGLSYILDINQGAEKAEKNIVRFSAYLVMFPKLIQGPITPYSGIRKDLENSRFSITDVLEGVRRFILGLAKKVILADRLGVAANAIFGSNFSEIGAGVAWFGLIAYALQIYFDFSGYTDMAIGLGKMLGFQLPENFNYPYVSRSITEFWRRWHMTLTGWFRNYVFLPLEIARRDERVLRQQSNILFVFLLTGLWHGASWNFIIWGGYFGLILVIEASGFGKLLKKAPRLLQHTYTLGVLLLGWIIFRITNILDWGPFLQALFGANGWSGSITLRSLNILFHVPLALIAVFFCIPLHTNIQKKLTTSPAYVRVLVDIQYLVIFALVISYILSKGFMPFMYAQF